MRAILLAVFLIAPRSYAAKVAVRIGFNPIDHSQAVSQNGKRLGDYVKRKTGLPVETFVAKDYDDLISALANGKADFAFLPPFSFVKAETEAGAHVLLKAVRRGRPSYFSAVLVRADSGLKRLEDLRGHSMAWWKPRAPPATSCPERPWPSWVSKLIPFSASRASYARTKTWCAPCSISAPTPEPPGANDPDGKVSSWRLYLHTPEELSQVKIIYVSDPIPGDAFATSESLWASRRADVDKVTKAMRRMG